MLFLNKTISAIITEGWQSSLWIIGRKLHVMGSMDGGMVYFCIISIFFLAIDLRVYPYIYTCMYVYTFTCYSSYLRTN